MKVSFPTPWDLDVVMSVDWVSGFEYPLAMKQEIREKFPKWAELHKGIEMNDTTIPWNMLDAYECRLAKITMADIIKSGEDEDLHKELIERAKQVLSVRQFRNDILNRYFSQGIRHEINRLMCQKSD